MEKDNQLLLIWYWVSFGSKKSFDDINNEVDSFWDILIAIFDNPIIIIDDLSLQSLKSDAILNLRNDYKITQYLIIFQLMACISLILGIDMV